MAIHKKQTAYVNRKFLLIYFASDLKHVTYMAYFSAIKGETDALALIRTVDAVRCTSLTTAEGRSRTSSHET